MALVAAIVVSAFAGYGQNEALEKNATVVASILRQAQLETLGSKDAVAYGVHLEETKAILFKGIYSSTDPFNRAYNFHPSIKISTVSLTGGGSDVVFERLLGTTANSGTVVFEKKEDPAAQRTITIKATGLVDY